MIQIILTWNGNFDDLESPFIASTPISEMVVDTYLVLLNEADDFDALEQEMEVINDVFVVGTYNEDGSQYQWGNPNSNRHHNIDKYRGKLKDVVEYDENGEETGSHPPTETEALATQVNKIYGWNDRTL